LPQSEYEYEYEDEFEDEFESALERQVNPIRRVYPDALMEHLGVAAAQAESEAEAEAFIGALIPLAARLLPKAASTVMKNAPGLIKGVANVTRTLRRSPATRPLVRAVPTIAKLTAQRIGQRASAGRPVTPQAAVRTLAQTARQVLSSPQQAARACQRSNKLDRRFKAAQARARRMGV
jgi:hypothetical protein